MILAAATALLHYEGRSKRYIFKVALRGIPLLAAAAALGCLLGLAATELPWGAPSNLHHIKFPQNLQCMQNINGCNTKTKSILSPEAGYSLVDQLRGYTMDRENNCIVEQVDIIS